jgi:CMP-N,N'-diacetyllegionaminic acid synthase
MIIAVIPAKGASSRLPNKNMQTIDGKPMIFYSLKIAKECELIDRVFVSTDSDEIEAYAKEQCVEVIRRGSELGGETPVVEVYAHALHALDNPSVELIVGIQPDHPDRKVELRDAIMYAIEKNYDEVITVDRDGHVNGSLKIMKAEALEYGRIGAVGTLMDDCTNVHYMSDLKTAETNLKEMQK